MNVTYIESETEYTKYFAPDITCDSDRHSKKVQSQGSTSLYCVPERSEVILCFF